jgi:hypothetical protein
VVIQLDGAADWLLDKDVLAGFDRDAPGAENGWLTRWRDFVDAGLHVSSATDAPWTFPGDGVADDMGRPVDQIASGMDGRLRTSLETPPWLSDQLLTADQALRTVTLDAAYALGDEARRGHLAPGTLGDVTILSGDVTAATPEEIRGMKVLATIVGGSPAFCADEEICAAPTAAPSPTAAAPSTAAAAGLPVGGSHVLWSEGGVEATVTIPAPGWEGDKAGGILVKNDSVDPPAGAGMIMFAAEDFFVYGDPCTWSSTTPATPASTVDALVTALGAQASRDASAPEDVTVDGHAGKRITLNVPGDADFAACD